MTRVLSLSALVLATACSDYELKHMQPGVDAPVDVTTEPVGTEPTEPTDPGTTPTLPSSVPCSDIDLEWDWYGSPVWDTSDDWSDAGGIPFWDLSHQLTDYSTVQLPDRNIPVAFDKAFVSWIDMPDNPPTIELDLQSDDGIWVWVNGQQVGHWGGGWQQEGCVNDNAMCLERVEVPPIDITPYLVPGANVIAARVSNAIEGSYFEIGGHCIE